MSHQDELAAKLVQALLVWREQGGPTGISLADATAIAARKNPGTSQLEMRSVVKSTNPRRKQ